MTATITAVPNPVSAGKQLAIYFDGGPSGGSVWITLDNGNGTSAQVEIDLDESGSGVAYWPVPSSGWTVIKINGGGALEEAVLVT